MKTKRIHTTLKLAYAPISNYEFYHLKEEGIVQQLFSKSTLYVIAQREELTFENVSIYDDGTLAFEIQKSGFAERLSCSLDITDVVPHVDPSRRVAIEFNWHDEALKSDELPLHGVKAIRFYLDSVEGEFLRWLSPDVFLHEYWNGNFPATVKGNIHEFTKFHVHYVGETTDQEMRDRLTGHKQLQDVLSIEKSLHTRSNLTHEVTLLLFQIENVDTVQTYDGTEDSSDMANEIYNPGSFPSREKITLDVEKALIKLLKPAKRYNWIQYKQYPKSSNGLYSHKFDRVAYKIEDNIILKYGNVSIIGDVNQMKSSTIIVKNNKNLLLENAPSHDTTVPDESGTV